MIFGRQICKLCKQLPDKLRVHTIPAKNMEKGVGGMEKICPTRGRTLPDHPTCHAKLEFDRRALQISAIMESSISKREKKRARPRAMCLRPFVITWTDKTGGPAGTSPGQRPGAEEGLGMWFAGTRAA